MKKKLTVLAAVEEEFEKIRLHRAELEKRWNCSIGFEAVGVGPVDAASGAQRAVEKYPGSEFLMVGSCGRYGQRLPLLVPVTPVTHRFGTLQFARNRAYAPAGIFDFIEISAFPGLDTCICLTTPGITGFVEDGLELHRYYEADVEHLESYAVVKTVRKSGRIIREVLVPVNDIGPDAHSEYLRNLNEGLSRLAEAVLTLEEYPWTE